MRAFFLYTELADYTIAGFAAHLKLNPNDEIFVVHYPVNPEAPFALKTVERLYLKEKSEVSVQELYAKIKPDVIVCSGWNDTEYNKLLATVKLKVPVYVIIDNIFRFTFRQILGLIYARLKFKKIYTGAWVPGNLQKKFAKLLGFDPKYIYTGFYSTDNKKYNEWYNQYREEKQIDFPKKLLCVARYIPVKGLNNLWDAFEKLSAEFPEWELWCAGIGENFEDRKIHPKINHLGFVQPDNFEKLIKECGVFVLPSLFEPWGVVVNEFAAAGFPLLLSDKVGSASTYLQAGKNGWLFEAGNRNSLEKTMRNIFQTSTRELLEMADYSNKLGMENSVAKWSEVLSTMAKKNGHM